jgi:hypothetical protein
MPTRLKVLPTPDTDALGNHIAGDCYFAMVGHLVRMVGQQIGDPTLGPTEAEVLAEYSRRTGYDPVTGANDVGFNMQAGMDIWSTEGFFRTKAVAWAYVGKSRAERTVANWLGCGTCGGFSLPITAKKQTDPVGRQLWYLPPGELTNNDAPASWGRHAIYGKSASPQLCDGTSWGQKVVWTWEWDDKYCDERILVITDAWLRTGRAPNGFALQDLLSDARARRLT